MKRILALIVLLSAACTATPQTISMQKADSIGRKFLHSQVSTRASFILSDTASLRKNNLNICYVFTFYNGGFVIVAANEAVAPILAYSSDAPLDVDHLPSNMAFWLDQQMQSIYETISVTQTQSSNMTQRNSFGQQPAKNGAKSVGPLCSTVWDQGCYYNSDCPSDSYGQCGHAAVGCVATAMAQVMKYWNYPLHGKDTHSYVAPIYGSLYADFGNATYNWAAMNDSLSAQNQAVAQLMSHCGIASDMQYGSTSSASSIRPAPFTQYFKYSLNASLISVSQYDSLSWVNRIRKELDAGRPVMYSGMPQPPLPTGHAWVCDGYDNSGFFHFNWGWSGWGNGYFQMNGFTYPLDNSAVVNLMPVQNDDVLVKSLLAPVAQTFTAPSAITVRIANYDTLAHTNIPICYRVDGGPVINDTITDTLAPLGESVFSFTQLYDFSGLAGHSYQISIYTAFPLDAFKENDTLRENVKNVQCAEPPYYTGFESGEDLDGWWINDANTDGYGWYIGSIGGHSGPGLAYTTSGLLQCDDWLISKCITLDTARLYKLSFWFKSSGLYWPQNFKVFMGNSNSIPALTTFLTGYSGQTSNAYQQSETWFSVPLPGSYYFGWNNISAPEMLALSLDDISITAIDGTDVGLGNVLSPVTGCDLQSEAVVVTVKNYCSSVLTNIPIAYSIDGGSVVNEIIPGTLQVGASINYNFSIPASCSAAGVHTFVIYTSLPGDTNFSNDTLRFSITNHHSALLPYSMGFESTEDYSEWSFENTNEDAYTWNIIASQGHLGPSCARYDYSSWIPANDWIITKCLHLQSGKTYRLQFWEKIEDPAWPESIAVYLGNAPTSASLNTVILDLPVLSNSSWNSYAPLFTVPSDGFYYIGWKCYSQAMMFNLYLDDILLEETTVGIENNTSARSFSVYPNPGDGRFFISDLSTMNDEKLIEITDPLGNILRTMTETSNKIEIDLSQQSAGVYWIRIITGKEISVLRLIKR
jgi:uncharacterized protein YfiM (DUF2279 family)